jgi:hypothetical protein
MYRSEHGATAKRAYHSRATRSSAVAMTTPTSKLETSTRGPLGLPPTNNSPHARFVKLCDPKYNTAGAVMSPLSPRHTRSNVLECSPPIANLLRITTGRSPVTPTRLPRTVAPTSRSACDRGTIAKMRLMAKSVGGSAGVPGHRHVSGVSEAALPCDSNGAAERGSIRIAHITFSHARLRTSPTCDETTTTTSAVGHCCPWAPCPRRGPPSVHTRLLCEDPSTPCGET